jgi:L1 cell adhesion molecule like protein
MDANGILNVSAVEKSSGKTNKITITNDKGRLSKEEIDRMVAESEKYQKEDDAIKEKIDAKQKLEAYTYQMKEQGKDNSELQEKIKVAEDLCSDLDLKEKEVYDSLQKELETLFMQNMAANAQTAPTSETPVEEPEFEPKIEEID